MQFAAFWTQTCPTTLPMQFTAFLDANIPYYDAYTICSFFGRKHALLLCPCNLQLFWTQICPYTIPMQFAAFLDAQICGKYKNLQEMRWKSPKNDANRLNFGHKNLHLLRLKPPKFDANSLDFGHKNFSFRMGVAGPGGPAAHQRLTPSVSRTVGSAKRRPNKALKGTLILRAGHSQSMILCDPLLGKGTLRIKIGS